MIEDCIIFSTWGGKYCFDPLEYQSRSLFLPKGTRYRINYRADGIVTNDFNFYIPFESIEGKYIIG